MLCGAARPAAWGVPAPYAHPQDTFNSSHNGLPLQVGTQSGAYELALLVGDARTAQPLLWVLGEVAVLLPPLDDGSQPAAAPYR